MTSDLFAFLSTLQSEGRLVSPIDLEILEAPSEAVAAETMDAWFDGANWRATGHRVVAFAQDGTGGQFGLWHYPELDGEPPVVLLGSEGSAAVLADSLLDFVRQTCAGMQWYPFEGEWNPIDEDEIDEDDEYALDLAGLRARADAELGPWTETSEAMMKRGVERHPDFKAWVEGLRG
ncbi:hypothetical protein ENSA5_15040 [Enhygromyxa salina]|uniref:SMI1/KNR4 family protein n=1 Tax=Enhygromyxa salina TaxID=215803 RepID=A0A2S9YEC9_9BACT|nr:hypothetical protein [Enhygromyxa salina]PRQ03474.1 hypothetical protein ENSA5_15040 [Enhygromyxa salina]